MSSTLVASTDPVAHIVAWLLGFVVACTMLLIFYTGVTGEELEESWSEIALGVTLIAAVLYALIRYRASKIAFLLETGERSPAVIEAFRAVDQWVWITLAYNCGGRAVQRRMLLPSSERTRSLGERAAVTVAMNPDSPGRLVVTGLYES